MNIIAVATKVLIKVLNQKQSLERALALVLTQQPTALNDPYLLKLCYGTLRWYHKLDAIIKSLLQRSKKLDPTIHILLLVGLYQLLYSRTPVYAILNNTVAAARVLQKNWATGFINAVLRKFTRGQEEILNQITDKYSHPLWLINLIKSAWSQQWQDILIANNTHPPMHLRVNFQKISRNDYIKKLAALGLQTLPLPTLASAITLAKPCPIEQLPGYYEGLVSNQDLAAQYAAYLLELKPGLRVLDACAAPGGKTAHILETEPQLQIIALDVTAKRLKMVATTLKRLQLSAKLICADASKPQNWWDGKKFERILLDAPCSGTGVIRRHPDIKVLRQPDDIAKHTNKQLALLEALWPLLTNNGLLVYATCSILPAENFAVIKKFSQQHSNVKIQSEKQLFPTINNTDGFYYAVLSKEH